MAGAMDDDAPNSRRALGVAQHDGDEPPEALLARRGRRSLARNPPVRRYLPLSILCRSGFPARVTESPSKHTPTAQGFIVTISQQHRLHDDHLVTEITKLRDSSGLRLCLSA
jgi:hypothetical protein